MRFRLRLRGKNRLRPRLNSLLNLSLLWVLAFLFGCGQVGQKETTQVSISFKIPSNNQKVLQAPAPTGITSITLEVSATDMTPITKSLAVTAGDTATIDLDVLAGPSREFTAEALDSNKTVIYRGTKTVDLIAGVATTVVIDMEAVVNTLINTLSITLAGNGSGTVTSSPAGINCGTDCQEPYTSGTQVTLTATPAAGSTFAGWSGGGCTGTGTCTVTMNAATSVTATFNSAPTIFTLTVTKTGTGTGSVTSSDSLINCGETCSASFNTGIIVTLTATPDPGSTFDGWSGACTGTGTCTVTMNAATIVAAAFNLQTFKLTILRRRPDRDRSPSWDPGNKA